MATQDFIEWYRVEFDKAIEGRNSYSERNEAAQRAVRENDEDVFIDAIANTGVSKNRVAFAASSNVVRGELASRIGRIAQVDRMREGRRESIRELSSQELRAKIELSNVRNPVSYLERQFDLERDEAIEQASRAGY